MGNLVPAVAGLLLFVLFVGFLAYKIAELPMIVIILAVVVLAVGDVVQQARRGEL